MPPFRYEDVVNPYAGSIGDLLGRQNAGRARAAEVAGNAWGNAIQQAGQIGAGVVDNIVRERREAPIRAQEAELRGLQLEEAREGAAARRAARDADATFTRILQSGTRPTPGIVLSLYGPERGAKIMDGLAAFENLEARKTADARADLGRVVTSLTVFGPELQKAMWPQVRQKAAEAGIGIELPEAASPEAIQGVLAWATGQAPAAPKTREIKRRNADGSEAIDIVEDKPGQSFTSAAPVEKVTYNAPQAMLVNGRRMMVRAGSDGAAYDMLGNKLTGTFAEAPPLPSQSESKQGWQWVLRGGQEVYTNQVQPGDKQLSGRQTRPVTGAERKVLGFFNRMLDAERNARAVEDNVGGRDFAAEWLPGSMLENFAKSDAGQRYTQAQRTFTEGRLRKESGAAIPQPEYDTDRDTNFKRPNDTPENIAQKRASRLRLLREAANESGRALEEYYGEGANIDSVLSEFADKGNGGQTPNLSGLRPGMGRKFTDGPFKGQTWTIGEDGTARQVE